MGFDGLNDTLVDDDDDDGDGGGDDDDDDDDGGGGGGGDDMFPLQLVLVAIIKWDFMRQKNVKG